MNLYFVVSDDGNIVTKLKAGEAETDFSYSAFVVKLFNRVALNKSEFDPKIKPEEQSKLEKLLAEIVLAATVKVPATEDQF